MFIHCNTNFYRATLTHLLHSSSSSSRTHKKHSPPLFWWAWWACFVTNKLHDEARKDAHLCVRKSPSVQNFLTHSHCKEHTHTHDDAPGVILEVCAEYMFELRDKPFWMNWGWLEWRRWPARRVELKRRKKKKTRKIDIFSTHWVFRSFAIFFLCLFYRVGEHCKEEKCVLLLFSWCSFTNWSLLH